MSADLQAKLRSLLDFPTPGTLFHDVSDLLLDANAFRGTVDWLAATARQHEPDLLAAVEARGFLFGSAAAYAMDVGLVVLRKAGKLPGKVVARDYALEYATATLELREDAVRPGQRVVLIEDLLATGGTLDAAASLLRQLGAVVPAALCVMELTFLGGREKAGVPVESLLRYSS